MRTHTSLAALLLLSLSFLQVPASAQADRRAQLQLLVVNQANAVVSGATVTIFTLDGNPAITVTTNRDGVATVRDLPTGMAEVYARYGSLVPYIEKTTLQPGGNAQTVRLLSGTDSE